MEIQNTKAIKYTLKGSKHIISRVFLYGAKSMWS